MLSIRLMWIGVLSLMMALPSSAYAAKDEPAKPTEKSAPTNKPHTTVYRDSQGRRAGTAETRGNKTVYRDASGRRTGTAERSGGKIIYRDAQGRRTGSAEG